MGKYAYRCEKCGALLDPGEKCDCDKEKIVLIVPDDKWGKEDEEKLKQVFKGDRK